MYAYKCSEIMTTQLECCVGSTAVKQVACLMRTSGIGAVPIVADLSTRRLLGIITDRDLALRVVAAGLDPSTTPASAVMTEKVLSCRPNDSLQCVLALMEEHRVRRAPVVDSEGSIIGIISAADVARRLKNVEATARLFQAISKERSLT